MATAPDGDRSRDWSIEDRAYVELRCLCQVATGSVVRSDVDSGDRSTGTDFDRSHTRVLPGDGLSQGALDQLESARTQPGFEAGDLGCISVSVASRSRETLPLRRRELDPNALEAAAVKAGVRPEIAYAIAKTGVFLMKENEHLYSDEDKEAFWAAAEEYRERSKRHDA